MNQASGRRQSVSLLQTALHRVVQQDRAVVRHRLGRDRRYRSDLTPQRPDQTGDTGDKRCQRRDQARANQGHIDSPWRLE
jgi:hypothetical protein